MIARDCALKALSRNHTSDCRLAIGDWRLLSNQSEWSSLQMLCSDWL